MSPDELLTHATAFRFLLYPDGHKYWDVAAEDVRIELRGGGRWAVLVRGFCVDTNGNMEYEPIPSERDDAFRARNRFSLDEAVRLAREVVVPAQRALWDARLAAKEASGG